MTPLFMFLQSLLKRTCAQLEIPYPDVPDLIRGHGMQHRFLVPLAYLAHEPELEDFSTHVVASHAPPQDLIRHRPEYGPDEQPALAFFAFIARALPDYVVGPVSSSVPLVDLF